MQQGNLKGVKSWFKGEFKDDTKNELLRNAAMSMLNSWKTDFFHIRKGKFMREIVHFSGHELFVLPDFHKLNSVSVEFLNSLIKDFDRQK